MMTNITLEQAKDRLERQMITDTIRRCKSIQEAAMHLGIHSFQFRSKNAEV